MKLHAMSCEQLHSWSVWSLNLPADAAWDCELRAASFLWLKALGVLTYEDMLQSLL